MSRWNRPIIDADLASTPSLGSEETLQAGIDAISTDVYGTQNSFKAVVLSPAIPRLITDVAALGYGTRPQPEIQKGSSLKPVFMFRARILDGAVPSPHAPLVDPCKISTAGDPHAALNAVVLHTMFYSAQNYAGDIPNVGDIVNVRLSPGDAKYNLQHGTFIDVDITGGRMLTAQMERECASLSTLFGGDIGMLSGYSGVSLEAPEEIARLAALYDSSGAGVKGAGLIDLLHQDFQPYMKALLMKLQEASFTNIQLNSGTRTKADTDKLIRRWEACGSKLPCRGFAAGPAAFPGSFHNYGMAIDMNVTKNGKEYSSADPKAAWAATGFPQIVESINLYWGGNFDKYDPVHVDFRTKLTELTGKGPTSAKKALRDVSAKSGNELHRVTIPTVV
jgi:hypothetical protein